MSHGWSNHEIYLVALWLDNDQKHYRYIKRLRKNKDEFEIAQDLKLYLKNQIPDELPGILSDLLNSAIENVDFREIAEMILEEED